MGWANNVDTTYSIQTSPCNVATYIASLPQGAGYYSDPGVSGGWCRTISAANVPAVRAQVGNSWVQHDTGLTYLPSSNFNFQIVVVKVFHIFPYLFLV